MKTQQGATSAIILDEDDQILFLRRSKTDDFMPGSWDIPGGGLDYGEEPEAGLRREVMEETGLKIEILRPLTVSTYFMGEVQRVDITFVCVAIDSHRLKLSSEHIDFAWIWLGEKEKINLLGFNGYLKKIADMAIKDIVNRGF